MKYFLFFPLVSLVYVSVYAQYTHADSLRGVYGETRDWWDVKRYELDVTFDIPTKEILGSNTITFGAEKRAQEKSFSDRIMQIDLQQPMVLDSIVFHNPDARQLTLTDQTWKKDSNAYLFPVSDNWLAEEQSQMIIYYHGKPREAVNPPWDGGVMWRKDKNGNPWVTIACQGLGASVWYPCKDSQADEIDNARMHFTCDSKLVCVSNGQFEGKAANNNGTTTYSWFVVNPINNYCIIPYIGDYVNMHEHYTGENGNLEIDYWVIRGNEEKAKKQFLDAPRTLKALEYWFGPYPFYEDGYKLIEAPHLGMEHQSAIAYGNNYRMGYAGTDLSGTGEGLKWDFIIVHESGHEWFGNNITTKDIADMWVQEGFTSYSETLFTEYWFGKNSASTYIIGLRNSIENDRPIIGNYGVNSEGSGDMYYKAANMLHTIRQLVGNDTLFRNMLRDLNKDFYHQTVTTQQIERYISEYLSLDLTAIFDQYLRTKNPPTLELVYTDKGATYRWINTIQGFNMKVYMNNYGWITPSAEWQELQFKGKLPASPNEQFYLLKKETFEKSYGRKFGKKTAGARRK